jgi:hypothetical protein
MRIRGPTKSGNLRIGKDTYPERTKPDTRKMGYQENRLVLMKQVRYWGIGQD